MGIINIARRLVETHEGQVLEEGEGTNEFANSWTWEKDIIHVEGFEGGREAVEGGERDPWVVEAMHNAGAQTQPCNTGEGLNQTARSDICRHDSPRAANKHDVGMIRRGIRMVRERLLPQLEFICGTELDLGEKVLSGARNP
jgi:hypothetical protein